MEAELAETSRHKCLIYEGDPSEQLPVIVPMLKSALQEERRCLYLGDPRMIQVVELEYEARLDRAFQELPLDGVCQYHRQTVPARAVRDALLTHRSVYAGQWLNKDNLFYLPPELLIEDPGRAVKDSQGEWMWQQLGRIGRAERERDQARAELHLIKAGRQ